MTIAGTVPLQSRLEPQPHGDFVIPLGFWVSPEVVFELLFSNEPVSFWLDNGEGSATGRSYMGAPSPSSWCAYQSTNSPEIRLSPLSGAPTQTRDGSILDYLAAELTGHFTLGSAHGAGPEFQLGWLAYFSYEFGAGLVGSPHHSSGPPYAAAMRVDRMIEFDHAEKTVVLRARADSEGVRAWLDSITSSLITANDDSRTVRRPADDEPLTSAAGILRHSRAEYLAMIETCQQHIRRGDAYLLCLTNEITVADTLSPIDTYSRLRRSNPSHHGALVRFHDLALLSSSPEQFLTVRSNGEITTRPIKGTRRRDADATEDLRLATELAESEKERAENVMIVDLMRNDLSRVARVGSVTVTQLFTVESYENVHQLVSTVSARLRPGLSCIDAVRVCLPGGSMTGTPKKSAMTILDGLEAGARGPYAGAFGYIGFDGDMDLAMTIRSIVIEPTRATIGTGGGITILSNPEEEFDEILLKAAPLLWAARSRHAGEV